MAKKIYCVSDYRNEPRGLVYKKGDAIEDDILIAFLMTDSPDSFSNKNPNAKKRSSAKKPPNKAAKSGKDK